MTVATGDRLSAIWRLALATGLRRGELLGLAWDDVDDRSVHVRRQVILRPRAVQGSRRLFVRSTLKNRRARRVRLDDRTGTELRRWRVTQSAERLAFGPAWKDDGGLGVQVEWIVTEADGTVVHPDTLLGRWKKLVNMAGVPAIPLHGARHSYAELALSSGVRLDVVSRTLGHSSSASRRTSTPTTATRRRPRRPSSSPGRSKGGETTWPQSRRYSRRTNPIHR